MIKVLEYHREEFKRRLDEMSAERYFPAHLHDAIFILFLESQNAAMNRRLAERLEEEK